jgi:O-succinylbenzoate synthase
MQTRFPNALSRMNALVNHDHKLGFKALFSSTIFQTLKTIKLVAVV